MSTLDLEQRVAEAFAAQTRDVSVSSADLAKIAARLGERPARRRPTRVLLTLAAALVLIAAVTLIATVTTRSSRNAPGGRATVEPLNTYLPSEYFIGRGALPVADPVTQSMAATSAIYSYAGGPAVRQIADITQQGVLLPDGRSAIGIRNRSASAVVRVDLTTGAVTTLAEATLRPSGPPVGDAAPPYVGGSIYAVAVSGDGSTIAYVEQDAETAGNKSQYGANKLVVQSLRTGESKTYAIGALGQIPSLALSPDGTRALLSPTHGDGALFLATFADADPIAHATRIPVTSCPSAVSVYQNPTWGPSGLFALRLCANEFRIMSIDPATARTVATDFVRTGDETSVALAGATGPESHPLFLINAQEGDTGTTTALTELVDSQGGAVIRTFSAGTGS